MTTKAQEKVKEKQKQQGRHYVQELKKCLMEKIKLPNDTAREVAWAFFHGKGSIQTSAWRLVTKTLSEDKGVKRNPESGNDSGEASSGDIAKAIKEFLA